MQSCFELLIRTLQIPLLSQHIRFSHQLTFEDGNVGACGIMTGVAEVGVVVLDILDGVITVWLTIAESSTFTDCASLDAMLVGKGKVRLDTKLGVLSAIAIKKELQSDNLSHWTRFNTVDPWTPKFSMTGFDGTYCMHKE